jgi:anti-sigma factor RsiW
VTGGQPIGEDDLQAFVDGRLAPARLEVVKAYLSDHPEIAARVGQEVEQREALRARLAFKAREPIPTRLRVANISAQRRRFHLRPAAVAAAVTWLAIGGIAGAAGTAWWRPPGQGVQEVSATGNAIAAYRTYVGERLHPVEVSADQETHLVQWLSRRLGKPLKAPNLSEQGFRLIGGRLLPAGQAPAALFMYENEGGNRLTLYVKTDDVEDQTAFRFESSAGVSAFSWIDNGLSYVVSGQTDRARLLTLAEAVYRQFQEQGGPSPGRL